MKSKLLLIILIQLSLTAFPQKELENNFLIELLETNIEANEDNADFNTLLEHYQDLYKHPININKANQDLLVSSGLFTLQQAQDLVNYRIQYGQFIDKEEIRTLSTINPKEANFIVHFISISTTESAKDLYKNGDHLLLSRYTRIIENQKGYENGNFKGSPDKTYFRYRYSISGSSSVGFTLEKDAGEQFSLIENKKTAGFDYLSYHVYIKPRYGKYTVALGDYSLQFGQGLHIWNGYALGKSAYPMNVPKYSAEIRPYTSVNENRYLRGGAVKYGEKISLTLFASQKSIDANLSDSGTFSSIQISGLHRTENELADKNSVKETLIGTRLSYRGERFKFGLVNTQNMLSLPLVKDNQAYNQFHYTGDQYYTTSFDYNYFTNKVEFFGETSVQWQSDIATINGLKFNYSPQTKFIFSHRYYGKSYFSLYPNAFSEGTNPNNEQAIYFGTELNFNSHWSALAYTDFYNFPWLKSGIDAPSKGRDYLAQLNYISSQSSSMYFRIKFESKEENVSTSAIEVARPTAYISPKETLRLRYHLNTTLNKRFSLRNRVEYVRVWQSTGINNSIPITEDGFLIFQDIALKTFHYKLTITARYALFDTKSFNTGIYAYESDVRYSFSVPAYYYVGTRYYIMLNYKLSKNTDLWIRYARFNYLDRETNGSGDNEIASNHKSEIKIQLSIQL